MKTVVLFGGTGFIGTHLAQHLIQQNAGWKIYLVDVKEPRRSCYAKVLTAGIESGQVHYKEHDVRQPIPQGLLPDQVDLVFNLAAVHREPGHQAHEYFDTNVPAADNVCEWASRIQVKTLVFTSSISPYGPSEEKKSEASVPAPVTPYGSSKLKAELIHRDWQAAQADRRLLILRPGVVFGPGEGGNVTRLLRSLVSGYFLYLGNRKTIKAAGYVKELCLVSQFCLEVLEQGGGRTMLVNFSMDPPPRIEDLVDAIRKVLGRRSFILSVSPKLLLGLSYPFDLITRLTGKGLPINAVRVRKLIRSNNVWPEQLRNLGYRYSYTLESAFRDWKNDCPEDFS